jgi:outer membrane protein assembly factor BamB
MCIRDRWRGDPAHGAVEDGTHSGLSELVWKFETNGQIYSSPSFFDGGMLIGSDDWNLYCLDPDTGELNWKYKTGGEVQSTAFIEGKRAYFGSFDGYLYCLELPEEISGRPSLEWKVELKGDVISSCHPYLDSVIVADTGGYLHRISNDGTILWSEKHSNDDIWASPVLDTAGGYGAIGNVTDSVIVFSLEDGSLIDTFGYGDKAEIYSSGLLADGILYLTDGEGRRLIAEDLARRGRGWVFEIGQPAYSTPVIEGERLYFGSFEFAWCIPAEDPDGNGFIDEDEVIWTTQTHDFQGGSSPLIAGDLMFIGSDDYNLYCIEKNTGKVMWTFETKGYVYSSPALHNGSVYFGSNDWSVYCVGDRPPGIVFEVVVDPVEINSDETARLWINVTDGEENLVRNATLDITASAGYITIGPDEIITNRIVAGSGRINLNVKPFSVSSRSTLDITITGEKEGLTSGSTTIQIIVEPGEETEAIDPDVIDRGRERMPFVIGLIAVITVNMSLFSVLVLFKVREVNTLREGSN